MTPNNFIPPFFLGCFSVESKPTILICIDAGKCPDFRNIVLSNVFPASLSLLLPSDRIMQVVSIAFLLPLAVDSERHRASTYYPACHWRCFIGHVHKGWLPGLQVCKRRVATSDTRCVYRVSCICAYVGDAPSVGVTTCPIGSFQAYSNLSRSLLATSDRVVCCRSEKA